MAKYIVEVVSGGIENQFRVEAYSPIEAAFLAGAGLGAVVGQHKAVRLAIAAIGATDQEIEETIQEAIRDGLSSVLVREVRYVD